MSDEQESESGKRERSGVLTVAVVVLLGLPAIYLFATGPINLLIERGYIDQRGLLVVQWVYAPLIYLLQSCKTCARLADLWFALWK